MEEVKYNVATFPCYSLKEREQETYTELIYETNIYSEVAGKYLTHRQSSLVKDEYEKREAILRFITESCIHQTLYKGSLLTSQRESYSPYQFKGKVYNGLMMIIRNSKKIDQEIETALTFNQSHRKSFSTSICRKRKKYTYMDLELKRKFRRGTGKDVFDWNEDNELVFTQQYVDWLEELVKEPDSLGKTKGIEKDISELICKLFVMIQITKHYKTKEAYRYAINELTLIRDGVSGSDGLEP